MRRRNSPRNSGPTSAPGIWQVGRGSEPIRFPGTLSLSAPTLIAVWTELGARVARAGLRKLALFNSHGGQLGAMDIVSRDLRTAHDLIVSSTNCFTLPLSTLQPDAQPR
jgi:creatinine amidohydrolase